MVPLQNVLVQSKKQEVQNIDWVQAPAEGQAGATRLCRRVGDAKRPPLSESQRQVLICLGLFQGWQKPLQVI